MSRLGRGQPQSTGYFGSAIGSQPSITVGGSITGAGAVIKRPAASRTGAITPAGAAVKRVAKPWAGAVTSASSIRWTVNRNVLAGAITSAGTQTRRMGKLVAGTLTSAAALVAVKIPGTTLQTLTAAGAITLAGAMVKRLGLTGQAGTITPAAAAIKWTASARQSSALTSAGALARRPGKVITGAVTSAGAQSTRTVTLAAFTAAITSAGALRKRVSISIARPASATYDGPFAYDDPSLLYTAQAGFALGGNLAFRPPLIFTGAIAMAGTVTKRVGKSFASSITSSGIYTNGQVQVLNIISYLETIGDLVVTLIEKHATRGKPGHTRGHGGKPGRTSGSPGKPGKTRK